MKILRSPIPLLILALAAGLLPGTARSASYQADTLHDFGHVGIDFKVTHSHWLVNTGEVPLVIKKVLSNCDCTTVYATDTTVPSGDTAYLVATFSTKDYYGPVARGFTVFLEDPDSTRIEFMQRAVVGQWYFGLKPDPFSLFFLPGQGSKKVTVTNTEHGEISFALRDQADTTFDVKLLRTKASRGEKLELEVTPRPTLKGGTYQSSFSIEVKVKGGAVPAILSVPVKIVRY